MKEIIEQIRAGRFTQYEYVLQLESGKKIWTANGSFGLKFHPESGNGFTFIEKRRIMAAIKEGTIRQALTQHP